MATNPGNRRLNLWLCLTSLFLSPCLGQCASSFYLFLPGIPGSSADKAHPKWIVAQDFQFGLAKPPGPGAASFQAVSVLKFVDTASPLLAEQCALGTPLTNDATFQMIVPIASTNLLQYQITLGDVRVTSVNVSGNTTNTAATESITLSFARITWTYIQYDANGMNPVNYTTSWDPEHLPLILTVTGVQNPGAGTITLSWPAIAGTTYNILGSSQVEGSYTFVQAVTAPNTGQMAVTVPAIGGRFFYRLQQLP